MAAAADDPASYDARVNPSGAASIRIESELTRVAKQLRRITVQVRSGWGGGSGVVWRPDGLIVTNSHVATTPELSVVLGDERTFQAVVVARDRGHDLAALRIPAAGLVAAEVRDPASLRTGELVLAMGNPAGTIGALATGIFHAAPVARWVQADIRLAPGNSGGPLTDARGKVIGINSMVVNGLALAVSSKLVEHFLTAKSRPRLGVTLQPVRIGVRKESSIKASIGLRVVELEPNSVAHLAGVRVGDILVAAGGARFQELDDLADAIDAALPSGTLVLEMIRNGALTRGAAARSGLEALLRGDARFEVIGSGPAIASAQTPLRGERPDVVLVDATGALNALSQFHFSETPAVVLLTEDWSRPQIRTALRSGARAILGPNSSRHEIAAALEAAAAGLTVLGVEQTEALLPSSRGPFDSPEISAEPLTPREIEVLALLAEGAGNKQIADRLRLSEHTVKFHVSSVLGKLGASSRTEAVAKGIRRGLVLV